MHGSTLIEVLVAVLLFSLGLLGMVGMQAASLQNDREARLQATAVRLAAELAERMRGNRSVAALPTSTGNPYLQSDTVAAPAFSGEDCFSTGCTTPMAVAQWDVAEWLQRLFSPATGLPGARVVVCFDSAPYDASGLPRWACTNSGDIAHVKIGWTRISTDRSRTGAAAFDLATAAGSHPSVTLPIAAGWPS